MIPKQPTGIKGLDEVLQGGLPKGRVTVLRGGHGTGKTVFALEFLWRNALAGEPGLFVTFEEQASSLKENALAMGWDFQRLEDEKKFAIIAIDLTPDIVMSGEFNIDGAIAIIRQKAKAIGAGVFAIDASDRLLGLFHDPSQRSRRLQGLHMALQNQKLTGIITVKDDAPGMDQFEYVSDCVLRLDQRVEDQINTRRLRVTKYRGSGYLSNEHPFLITSSGVRLLPVSGVGLSYAPPSARASSGVSQLDELLGGGYFAGTSVIIAGASGTGKTTLASTFSAAACAAGGRVLFASYEESESSLVRAMLSPGIDLRPQLEAGCLRVLSSLPEAMGPDQHLFSIIEAIEEFSPHHVVVDAISATARMGSENAAFDFQVRLIYHCKDRGITCVFTTQARQWTRMSDMANFELSSLAECVVGLEQEWRDEGFERRIAVIKSRGTNHANGVYPFHITSRGVEIESAPVIPGHRSPHARESEGGRDA